MEYFVFPILLTLIFIAIFLRERLKKRWKTGKTSEPTSDEWVITSASADDRHEAPDNRESRSTRMDIPGAPRKNKSKQ